MIDELVIQKDLTDTEKLMFQSEFNAIRKNSTTGVILALFLGGLGVHHFYMGRIGLGVLYLAFCWTFIPAIVALIECFFMSNRVREHNQQAAFKIVTEIKAIR